MSALSSATRGLPLRSLPAAGRYLATSPGGVDAAAIIAASTKVDTPFVMALQTIRVIVVLAVGPHVAGRVAGTLQSSAPHTGSVARPCASRRCFAFGPPPRW